MIFLLKRTDIIDWDEYDAKVVRAKNEKEARKIANLALDKHVTCEVIYPAGESGEILSSFCAG